LIPKQYRSLLVHPYPASEVTTISGNECDPRDVGVEPKVVKAIWDSVILYYRTGLHPAISLCIRRRGKVILERSIGHSQGNTPHNHDSNKLVLARPETPFNIFSASKSITAMLIHLLQEQNQLHVDEPIATFIPEFAKKRKHHITIKDVLLHRAGIPTVPLKNIDIDQIQNRQYIVDLICDLKPQSVPGEHPAYHAITGGYILGEIIERITSQSLQQFLREKVTTPGNFRFFRFGVDNKELESLAQESMTGPPPAWPYDYLIQRAFSSTFEELINFANDPRFLKAVVPAANLCTTANDLSRFYELLLCGGLIDGKRIFPARAVRNAVKPQIKNKIDRIMMLPIPYSMGFMLGGNALSLYGPLTPRAFGHMGFTNILGWADPERDISVGLLNNGKPLFSTNIALWLNISRTIAQKIPRDHRSPR
jgi:CubicO group peptidase (beta-lactamase class C family)